MKNKKRQWKDEKGAIMMIVAILISVLLAFTAFVIDFGVAYHNKAKLQTASDSVSLAVANMVSETQDFNPVKNATQGANVKKKVQLYFQQNGVDTFTTNSNNIELYSLSKKQQVLKTLNENSDKDVVYIFYASDETLTTVDSSTDDTSTDDTYRYIEVYAHLKTQSIFGKIFDIDYFKLTVDSAAKCNLVSSGIPDVLNYQILNLNANESFDITGPIEDTFLKTITNFTETGINFGLDFLQNKTRLISTYVMGGKTQFTCPQCSLTGYEASFLAYDAEGNEYYVCPNCNHEVTVDDSNKVSVNLTTSTAVINGYIHSNGGVSVKTDTLRMNRSLSNPYTETDTQKIIGEDSTWVYYSNGKKYSARPMLTLALGADSLTLQGNNGQDVFLMGEAYQPYNMDSLVYPTVYKSASSAKTWDFSRVSKQFLYGANSDGFNIENQGTTVEAIEDPGLTTYIQSTYENLSKTNGAANVGAITKQDSGSTYTVSFDETADELYQTPSSSASTVDSYDLLVNDKKLLGSISLNNGKALPSVYSTFDSYYKFDFDNDSSTSDSLQNVIDGTVTVAKKAQTQDNSVAQIVANNRSTYSSDGSTTKDDVRQQIDKLVTDITGEVHSIGNVTLKHTIKDEFDINVEKGVSVSGTNATNDLRVIETNFTQSSNLKNNGVGSTVSYYNSAIAKSINFKYFYGLNAKSSDSTTTVSTNYLDRDMQVALAEYKNIDSEAYLPTTFTLNSVTYNPEDFIAGRDGEVKLSIKDIVENYSTKTEISVPSSTDGYSNGGSISGSGYSSTIVLADKTYYTKISSPYSGSLYKTYRSTAVTSGYDCYITGDWSLSTDQGKGLDIQEGTASKKTVLYIGGNLTLSGDSDNYVKLASNSILVVHGNLNVAKGYVNVEDGAMLIVDGTITVNNSGSLNINGSGQVLCDNTIDCSSINASTDSIITALGDVYSGNTAGLSFGTVYCKGSIEAEKGSVVINGNAFVYDDVSSSGSVTISSGASLVTTKISNSGSINIMENSVLVDLDSISSSNNLAIRDFATVYIGQNLSCGTLNIYQGTRIHVDGDITTSGFFDGVNASDWAVSCKGNITVNGSTSDQKSGLGSNCYLYTGGYYHSNSAFFNNKGIVYCSGDFTASEILNQNKMYCLGEIRAKGAITNKGDMYTRYSIITAEKGDFTNGEGNSVIAKAIYQYNGTLANEGFLYSEGIIDCNLMSNGSSGNIYAGGNISISSGSESVYLYGWVYTNGMITGNAKLNVKGIICVNGSPVDSSGYTVSDANIADHVQGIACDCVNIYDSGQIYVNGRLNCNSNGLVYKTDNTNDSGDVLNDITAQIFIYDPNDSGYALSTNTYLKLISGAQLYVIGNAYISEKNSTSVYNDSRTYMYVSGTLTTSKSFAISANSLLHCGNLVTGTDMYVGIESMTSDIATATGLIVDNNVNTGSSEFAVFAVAQIGGSVTSGAFRTDDYGLAYVAGDVNCTQLTAWDMSNAYIAGSVNATSTSSGSVKLGDDHVGNVFIAGDLTAGYDILINNEGSLLVGGSVYAKMGGGTGTITDNAIAITGSGILYAKGDITFNSQNASTENILYTDGNLVSEYANGTSTLSYGDLNKLEYTLLKNITLKKTDITNKNTSTKYISNIIKLSSLSGDLSLGAAGKTVTIKSGVTIYTIGIDIYLDGDVENSGSIVCLQDSAGRGGNIIARDTDGNEYCSVLNYGKIYCDGDFSIQGTSHKTTVGVWSHMGLSLQNGKTSNSNAYIYVGGNLSAYAGIDNFGKTYVGGNVETTTKYDPYTYSGGQNAWGVGLDVENNSVFMAGGHIDVQQGGSDPTSIVVRSNAVMYCGSNVRNTRNLIIGNAFMQGGTTSETGSAQFVYMNSSAYNGLKENITGYVECDLTTQNALKVVSGTASSGEISLSDISGSAYDSNGNALSDASILVGKYVVYQSVVNGRNNTNVYDYGFVYIEGTLTTGTSSSNYVQPYGKSVLYINGNEEKCSSDSLYNSNYALETHHIFTYPYSRTYVGGNLKTYGGNSDKIAINEWFYSYLFVNGNAEFAGQTKLRDGTRTIINGNLTSSRYTEIGKAYDGVDEAYDPNNTAFVQCNGNLTTGGYLKIYARATVNVNGDVTPDSYITLRHGSALRANGNATATQFDIGSCSTLYVGKTMKASSLNLTGANGTIKIRDNCDVSIGGNGGGDMIATRYIELGKHEDEDYKYKTCAENRTSTIKNSDYISPDDEDTGASTEDADPGEDSDSTTVITCPNCGKEGTVSGGAFSETQVDEVDTYTCASCGQVFDDTADAFEEDSAVGSTIYVNGTINSYTSYLKLFANTEAYATKSIRSFKYITLRHHAGLYVTTSSPNASGIMFDLGDNNELLKTDGTAVPNFYVDTDTTSVEYGNIYYSCTIDGEATKLYGFSVEPDDSESYDVDESQGYLWQTGMLYYYSNDEKVYYGESSEETLDGELVTTVNYYYMDSSYNLVLPTDGSTPSASQVNGSDLIALVVTEGSINSYGPLSINSYGEMYATGDIRAWGKTIISNKAVVYTKGDFVCTKIISLSSLLDSASTGVCGFEFRHAALHADGDIRLYSCTEIEGGTIDAVGDIIFDGIYNEYQYEYVDSTTTPYTDPTKVDLWICSESGNVDFNCIFNSLGGVTYAPNGKITMDGIYFEHYGCLIAGDNDINAFYVNVHRLPNSDTVDIQWTQPGNVYLCTPMDE